MKPDHLIQNSTKIVKIRTKKYQYNYDIKSITFLGFYIHSTLVITSHDTLNKSALDNSFLNFQEADHRSKIDLILLTVLFSFFLFVFFFVLLEFFINESFAYSNNLPLLNLMFNSHLSNSNVLINALNRCFNDLLISILQEYKII